MLGRIPSSTDSLPNRPGNRDTRDWPLTDKVALLGGVFTLIVGLLLLGLWVLTPTSYEKCAAVADYQSRIDCFEHVRADSRTQSPAKGPKAPVDALRE
jgi:hypothetical protein